MDFFVKALEILDWRMQRPTMYGWFHWMWLALTIAACVLLWRYCRNTPVERTRAAVFWTAVVVLVLELYKQINYTFGYDTGTVTVDFQWYAFPWQFCSMPMYVGFLMGIMRKGKIHDALAAFLATYAVFAGVCVLLYPSDVFISTIGINVQTMICHCSMIVIGVYLMVTGYVKLEHKTILKAIPVFAVAVGLAAIMNEIAYYSGLLETDTFNMFFISPHCEPSLPVYSLVQQVVPFPFCLIIYIAAFSLAAYLILLIAMGIQSILRSVRGHKVLALLVFMQ
ncbi:MAG: YwaF family protein [Clostridia bacterium]|nr:YwaF family protein [Clostridia bacterium]